MVEVVVVEGGGIESSKAIGSSDVGTEGVVITVPLGLRRNTFRRSIARIDLSDSLLVERWVGSDDDVVISCAVS